MIFDEKVMEMLLEGIRDTLFMVLVSTAAGYALGLPLGILLAVSGKDGIHPRPVLYRIFDIITNILRSVPFLILLILVIPLTRAIIGRSYGPEATIVPLTLAAAPFIGRMVEAALGEARISLLIGVTISMGTVLGYSAMAGVIGGGGLGDIAIRYGYYRYDTQIMIITVVILVALVQVLQFIGMRLAARVDKRKK